MDYISLMKTRYACKEFNNEKIPSHILSKILYAGVLSPSSLGLEPWIFYVISKKNDLEKLKNHCNSKKQFETCSHAVILAAKNNYNPQGRVVQKALKRRADFDKVYELYTPYLKRLEKRNAHEYGALQCYIVGTNMVNCATSEGVQSCIIGGYEECGINKDFLKNDEFCALVLTFGYEKEPSKHNKIRYDFNEVVKFI